MYYNPFSRVVLWSSQMCWLSDCNDWGARYSANLNLTSLTDSWVEHRGIEYLIFHVVSRRRCECGPCTWDADKSDSGKRHLLYSNFHTLFQFVLSVASHIGVLIVAAVVLCPIPRWSAWTITDNQFIVPIVSTWQSFRSLNLIGVVHSLFVRSMCALLSASSHSNFSKFF